MATAVTKTTRLLYEDIVLGRYPFGTGLKEEPLSRSYSVTRNTLREAFTQLEEVGFVVRIPNRGVYVREPTPQEVRETYQIRTLLELHAARITSLPISKTVAAKMKALQDRHSAAIRAGNYRDVLHLNTEFHRLQYSCCGNRTLVAAIEDYATRTHLITSMKFGEIDVMEQVIQQHLAIIAALEGTDHEQLVACIQAHFNMSRVDQYQTLYQMRHGDDADFAPPPPLHSRIVF